MHHHLHNTVCFMSTDVEGVISRNPHTHGQWSFDVAEFYHEIGTSEPGSLCTYQNVYGSHDSEY